VAGAAATLSSNFVFFVCLFSNHLELMRSIEQHLSPA
jgi:hypothetical protein